MKENLRKYWALALILILISSVCFLFSCRKSGMFIDEIYTYGLSNSTKGPYLVSIKGGDMADTVFTHEELFDYAAVTGNEGADFESVYYNQSMDVHPPLYYWLFNLASTLAFGTFSKWTGLILDYIIYMLAVLMLYKLVRKLHGSRDCACAAAVLYGLSVIGLSTMLMIRMYVLLALFTLVLAYYIACLMEEFRPKYCVLSGLALLCGMMTQYYFVFYAFFLCAAYLVFAIAHKQYRALRWFIPCALIGAAAVVVLFPACLTQLFSGNLVSGESAVDNIKNLSQYPARLKTFIGAARHGLKASIYVALAAVCGLLIIRKKLCEVSKSGKLSFNALYIILPAFVTFLLVAVISPVDEARYIYNLIPIFVLAVAFLLYLFEGSAGEVQNRYIKKTLLLCICAVALWEARCAPPDYLYPEYAQYDALLSDYASAPCVCFNDNRFEAMTQDLQQLLIFDDVYVSRDDSFEGMLKYLGDDDEFVAFVDISEFWGSGYKPDEIFLALSECSDYDNAELLYQNGLSATYVISK